MGGEIGVKTIVYNALKGERKEGTKKKRRESKRLKKYNSKKEEFCTLNHTTRA